MGVTGAVLAGGRSVRLGTDKALLRLDGKALLADVVGKVATVADEVLVVGRDSREHWPPARVVADLRPAAGSLGGIHTALREARAPRCLVVGCDMPFLNTRLLSYLLDLSPGYDVVIPRVDAHFEPLHAVYSRRCLGPIEQLLDRGERRILDFFDQVSVRYVDREELSVFDPHLHSLFNINTPAQLQQALAVMREGGGQVRP